MARGTNRSVLVANAPVQRYNAGEFLVSEGSEEKKLFLILSARGLGEPQKKQGCRCLSQCVLVGDGGLVVPLFLSAALQGRCVRGRHQERSSTCGR
eukprot:3018885-Rhodomonas_salina.5